MACRAVGANTSAQTTLPNPARTAASRNQRRQRCGSRHSRRARGCHRRTTPSPSTQLRSWSPDRTRFTCGHPRSVRSHVCRYSNRPTFARSDSRRLSSHILPTVRKASHWSVPRRGSNVSTAYTHHGRDVTPAAHLRKSTAPRHAAHLRQRHEPHLNGIRTGCRASLGPDRGHSATLHASRSQAFTDARCGRPRSGSHRDSGSPGCQSCVTFEPPEHGVILSSNKTAATGCAGRRRT